MRYKVLIALLIFISGSAFPQSDQETKKVNKRLKWYLLFMGADYGGLSSSLNTSLQPESEFILGSNHNGVVGFSLFEIQPVIYNKFGFTIGLFEFRQANMDKNLVRTEFQNYIQDYTVFFPDDDYENGEVPISGGFNSFHSKVGLFGNFQLKNFAITPFINYLLTYGKQTYYVSPYLTDPLTNTTFRRRYTIEEGFDKGLNPGIDLRYLHDSGFVLGLRTQLNFLYGKGTVSTKDISESGAETQGVTSEFEHNFTSYSAGLYVGFRIGRNKKNR